MQHPFMAENFAEQLGISLTCTLCEKLQRDDLAEFSEGVIKTGAVVILKRFHNEHKLPELIIEQQLAKPDLSASERHAPLKVPAAATALISRLNTIWIVTIEAEEQQGYS